MEFTDNFIEVKPGYMIDPLTKLTLGTGRSPDDPGFSSGNLLLGYDPEIRQDRLLVPPSDEIRKLRMMRTSDSDVINAPIVFSSENKIAIVSIGFDWSISSEILIFKIRPTERFLKSHVEFMKFEKFPVAGDHPKEVLRYAISSLTQMHAICSKPIAKEFPNARRIETWLSSSAADYLGFEKNNCPEVESGWICVSSREAGQ